MPSPHIAIGTSAFAVAVNAFANLLKHAHNGNVKWRCGILYSLVGILGAFAGSTIGKMMNGQHLLVLFTLPMFLVGILMLRGKGAGGDPDAQCSRENAFKVMTYGGLTGMFAGAFGIGGGFLIVPSLIAATGMPILFAIGSSLVVVTAFGLTTAINYAVSGLVDWLLAIAFITGGTIGGLAGAAAACRISENKNMLNRAFALMLILVAGYMLYNGYRTLATSERAGSQYEPSCAPATLGSSCVRKVGDQNSVGNHAHFLICAPAGDML